MSVTFTLGRIMQRRMFEGREAEREIEVPLIEIRGLADHRGFHDNVVVREATETDAKQYPAAWGSFRATLGPLPPGAQEARSEAASTSQPTTQPDAALGEEKPVVTS